MTTFSQLVDKIVSETRRKDLLVDVSTYLNQTIRECHFDPESNASVIYRDNFRETLLTAGAPSGLTWDIPNPNLFHGMALVKYTGIWIDGENPYPPEMTPGRGLSGLERYYYRGGSRYAFAGYGGIGASIALGYYEYPRNLKYKALVSREAQWDDEGGWTYGAGIATDEQKLAALELNTNWLLNRWETVIEEGLRAKVYKRISDDTRARTCYSLYAQLRKGLVSAESLIQGYQ